MLLLNTEVRWGHFGVQRCLSTFFSAVNFLIGDTESSLAVPTDARRYGLQVEGS